VNPVALRSQFSFVTHTVPTNPQGMGGDQGDAFMPVLLRFSVTRTPTALFTFSDDPYVIFQLQKVEKVHDATRDELWTHARIRLHDGKTKLWNRRVLQSRASVEVRQSTPIISTRLNDSRKSRGHPELVHAQLEAKKSEHQILLERILQTCYRVTPAPVLRICSRQPQPAQRQS